MILLTRKVSEKDVIRAELEEARKVAEISPLDLAKLRVVNDRHTALTEDYKHAQDVAIEVQGEVSQLKKQVEIGNMHKQ